MIAAKQSIEHTVETLVGQRLFAIVLSYEDLNDHDELRHDPVMAVLAGKLRARRKRCPPVAGKSTPITIGATARGGHGPRSRRATTRSVTIPVPSLKCAALRRGRREMGLTNLPVDGCKSFPASRE
jgi:hypothetical protein